MNRDKYATPGGYVRGSLLLAMLLTSAVAVVVAGFHYAIK